MDAAFYRTDHPWRQAIAHTLSGPAPDPALGLDLDFDLSLPDFELPDLDAVAAAPNTPTQD